MTTKYSPDQIRDAHFARSVKSAAWANSCSPEAILQEDYTEYDTDNNPTLGDAYRDARDRYHRGQGILNNARLSYSERHAPPGDGEDTAEVWSGYRATSPTTRTARLTPKG